MTTWLEYVNTAIDAVTEEEIASVAPTGNGCSHEHVVGVATPELKKLYFLYVSCAKRANAAKEKLVRTEDCAVRSQLEKEIIGYSVHAEAYEPIFWASIRHTYPELSDKRFIGVREDWKVVWSEHDPEESLEELLVALRKGDAIGYALAATAEMLRRR